MAVRDENSKQSCLLGCAIAGVFAGVVLAAARFIGMDYGSAASIFLGGVAAVVLAALMMIVFCRELPAPIDQSQASATPPAKPSEAKPAAQATATAAASAAATATAAPKPASEPAAKKAAPKPAAKPKSEPKPKTKAAAAPKAAEKPKAAAKSEGGKPEGLKKARGGKPDNLKEIKGIGPQLEKLLNSMGYFHFDQIAAWKKKDVEWVDDNLLKFKGRASRDEWVKQAKVLAKGGATEFSKRVGKGDVY